MGFLGISRKTTTNMLVVGVIVFLVVLLVGMERVNGIGANWGTQATHPLSPRTVVKLLKDNGIEKVKLFDADYLTLNALSGSGIEVMVGIPNDMLLSLANSMDAADRWVHNNVSAHPSSNIRYAAVGNEPFLSTYNGTYLTTTLPALQNIQAALTKAGLANTVKVIVPLNADVYQSSTPLPSTGDFRPEIHDRMIEIVKFLNDISSPFTVNIYPFISLYKDPNFPVDYAFFDSSSSSSSINDNGRIYDNVFDANYDTLLWALQKNGFGNMSVIVGEIGWPTDGDRNANANYAQRFNQGFMNHVSTKGTPLRPGNTIDAYLFSLIDEDAKSIQPGNFERHWGVFNYDGTPKYNLSLGSNLGGRGLVGATGVRYMDQQWCVMDPSASLDSPDIAESVSYACANADCTCLGYGTSCADLSARENISYAFNSYYQQQNQVVSACQFPNLSVITNVDPSRGDCRFKIMIVSEGPIPGRPISASSGLKHSVFLIAFLIVLVLAAFGF